MKRPFPGMNPWLEDPAFWPDFHQRFITYWSDLLTGALPEEYDVRIDERVNLVSETDRSVQRFMPDLAISAPEPGDWSASGGESASAAAVLEPITVPVEMLDEETEGYLQILHRPTERLVSVLELLSPANKKSPGRRDYLAKRHAVLREDVHLVEIDLLTRGQRLPMSGALPPGDYFAIVSRWEARPDCEVYAGSVRSPLPRIRIPLRAPDADLVSDLGEVFATTWERGRYERRLRYAEPLPAALSDADVDWAAEFVSK